MDTEVFPMKTNKASHPRWLLPVLAGAACLALILLAGWHAVTYNGGRLVYPMDSYVFQPADIPMLLSIGLDVLYVLYLVALLIGGILAQRKRAASTNRTRRLNPKLGLLGFLGFLGFAGFWSLPAFGNYTPFCFFLFFGFFGFFYEGKMSNTLMDERYRENALRAERAAYKTGLNIIFLLLLIAGQGRVPAERMAAALLIGISLALGLTLFLGEYLLYRYDHADAAGLEDGE